MRNYIFFFSIIFLFASCATRPPSDFSQNLVPVKPNYASLETWAAHPDKWDNADSVVQSQIKKSVLFDSVDVFFIHPTSYTGDRGEKFWNADIHDEKVNEKTDEGAILFQASIFNTVGKIYAPRYRQAHLHVYFTRKKQEAARNAIELAYKDVENAFQHYLDHWNDGKPFIIASHSQGTTHAIRLIQEKIESTNLKKQLVCAYLVGMPVPLSSFDSLDICENEDDINCFCSWRTYKTGTLPRNHIKGNNVGVTNPLSWKTDDKYIGPDQNLGAVLFFEEGYMKGMFDAEIHDGLLWTTKPKFRGSWLIVTSNFHRGDYNLFYANIRENANNRVIKYFKQY